MFSRPKITQSSGAGKAGDSVDKFTVVLCQLYQRGNLNDNLLNIRERKKKDRRKKDTKKGEGWKQREGYEKRQEEWEQKRNKKRARKIKSLLSD